MAKNLPANARDARDAVSIPGSGDWRGNGNPLQYSCLENSMDGGAWQATVHVITKSQTQLSEHTHRNPIQCLSWLLFLFSIKTFFLIFIWGGHTTWHYGILVPQPLIEPMLPAVEAQSLNHWTSREVLPCFLCWSCWVLPSIFPQPSLVKPAWKDSLV